MQKRSSKRDLNQTAFSVVRQATRTADAKSAHSNRQAEAKDLTHMIADEKAHAKNPAAVALGRLGGLKGGKARAKKLSSAKRKEIARKAAQSRWKTKQLAN